MRGLREKMLEGFVPNVLNPREMILIDADGAPLGGVTLWHLSEEAWGPNHIHLEDMRALSRGGGRKVMELLVERADRYGAVLSGHVYPLGAAPGGGKKLSVRKLLEWYKAFGFVEDPPKSRDIVRLPTGASAR